MPAFQRTDAFIGALGNAAVNFGTHTFKLRLTNDALDPATDSVAADFTEIAATGGYSTGGWTAAVTWAADGSSWVLAFTQDEGITASGGDIGPFRCVALIDDTHASDLIVGFWDRGSSFTLPDGGTFTLDVDADFTVWTLT